MRNPSSRIECIFTLLLCCISAMMAKYVARMTVDEPMKVDTCPCSNPEWCKIITKTVDKEVYGFSTSNYSSHWDQYPWDKLTTVAVIGGRFTVMNTSFVCQGHSHGVRVVYTVDTNRDIMVNLTARKEFVDKTISTVTNNFMDGVNFDVEGIMDKSDRQAQEAFTATVKSVYDTLKAISPHYQVSIDVSWRPNEYDRYYAYYNLSQVSDFLFVMAYDEPMRKMYLAGPNSGLDYARKGIELYQNYPAGKIDASKLVLGVPWYGDVYKCAWMTGEDCNRLGSGGPTPQMGLDKIVPLLMTVPEAYRWNASSSTPYLTYKDKTGQIIQIQYDDTWSVMLKYRLANQMGLRGVGMWCLDSLDYSDAGWARRFRDDMFATFDAFLQGN